MKKPKRTILYYPTISVPTNSWLRQSLLYWDEIASIVPQSMDTYSPDIAFLKSEGEFRPIRPDSLATLEGWSEARKLQDEFIGILISSEFPFRLPEQPLEKVGMRIHKDKLSHSILDEFLEPMGLAIIDRSDDNWILVEKNTALLYMALLAKYLATNDSHSTTPGTDRQEYENLIFKAMPENESSFCFSTSFYNVLPIPNENVPLVDIVKFKQKRRSELLQFRKQLDEFHTNLNKCQNKSDINHVLVSFGENVEKGILDFNALMKDSRIQTAMGSLKTLIQPTTATLWMTVGATITTGMKLAGIPLEWSLKSIGVLAAVDISAYLIEKLNTSKIKSKDSPFSYVYSTTEEGLTAKFEETTRDEMPTVFPRTHRPQTFA